MAKQRMFDLSKLRLNPNNPYPERAADWPKFLKKLKENPEYLELRPIVYDDQDIENGQFLVLGGNKRTKGLKELGFTEVPESWVRAASMLSAEQKHEFIVADNANWGEWDMDKVLSGWGESILSEWGIEAIGGHEEKENEYTRKITAPTYTPKEPKAPNVETLYDDTRTNSLIAVINEVSIPDDVRKFLTLAAMRHTVFDYEQIAEYYSHASREVQELMEESALVIIDFDKAIELGFVKLNADILQQFNDDHAE